MTDHYRALWDLAVADRDRYKGLLYDAWRTICSQQKGLKRQARRIKALRYRVAELEQRTIEAEESEQRIRNIWCNGVTSLLGDYRGEPVPAADDPQSMVQLEAMIKQLHSRVTELERDADRLAALVCPECVLDGIGAIDIHEEASVNASAFGREQPNKDDYLAALRTAIDAAMREGEE